MAYSAPNGGPALLRFQAVLAHSRLPNSRSAPVAVMRTMPKRRHSVRGSEVRFRVRCLLRIADIQADQPEGQFLARMSPLQVCLSIVTSPPPSTLLRPSGPTRLSRRDDLHPLRGDDVSVPSKIDNAGRGRRPVLIRARTSPVMRAGEPPFAPRVASPLDSLGHSFV